jgi:hypothetical protein
MMALALTLLALFCLALVRNDLVYRIRIRRIDEIHEHNVRVIRGHDFSGGTRPLTVDFNLSDPSYDAMLFDLRRWTYAQFYPVAPEAQQQRAA